MALQYWFPLTQDSRQQGLNSTISTIMGTGITFVAGKLGKAAQFPNNCNSCINVPGLKLQTGSWAAWIKVLGSGATARQCLISEGRDSYNDGVEFYTNQAGTTLYFKAHTVILSTTIALNTWYHVVGTFGNNSIKLYVDGVLKASNTYTDDMTYTYSNDRFVLGKMAYSYTSTSNYFAYNGCLNDVRVYDHVLSQMEVKELAKGLVLHYSLNRNGWGRENNIAVAKIANRSCSNFTYNSSTQEWTMTCPTGSSTWGYGIVINDRNIRWAVSETWVVSMEVYVPRAITWNCDINNKPDLEDISQYTGNDYDITGQRQVCTNGTKGSKSLQTGWNKIWFSQTANTTYGLTNYSTNWGIITTNESSAIDIKIRNIKGEVIEANAEIKPTAWCANVADSSNTNVEYDCSGFGNNGEKSGVFTYTLDKSKYALSTHIGANTTKIHISNFPTSGFGNSYSFAWWGKRSDNGPMFWGFSDGVRLNGMYTGRLWNTGDSSNNPLYNIGTTTQVTAPSTNTWHHYVMTGNGTKCYVYLDGELWAEAKTYKAISGTSIWINGWDSGTSYCHTNCDMSDFRIYATALSATDVLSLYQNNAYIDDSGNIYGKIRD